MDMYKKLLKRAQDETELCLFVKCYVQRDTAKPVAI